MSTATEQFFTEKVATALERWLDFMAGFDAVELEVLTAAFRQAGLWVEATAPRLAVAVDELAGVTEQMRRARVALDEELGK